MNLFHCPSTWVFVDDEERFIESIGEIVPENQPARFFTNPYEAKDYVLTNSFNEGSMGASYQGLELAKLQEATLTPDRFAPASVIIADYAMPGMDGLALFEELSGTHCGKVLLTGVATEETALAAFNRGFFDRFIKKGDANALTKILDYAECLDEQISTDKQRLISLPEDSHYVVNSKNFIHAFDELLVQYGIVEYYYCEDPLGFLCINPTGDCYFVVVATESVLERRMPMALSTCPQHIANMVANRRALTELFEQSDEYDNDYDWKFNTVELEKVVDEKIWFGIHMDPPCDIDYASARLSLSAFLGGAQLERA